MYELIPKKVGQEVYIQLHENIKVFDKAIIDSIDDKLFYCVGVDDIDGQPAFHVYRTAADIFSKEDIINKIDALLHYFKQPLMSVYFYDERIQHMEHDIADNFFIIRHSYECIEVFYAFDDVREMKNFLDTKFTIKQSIMVI